MVDGCAKICVLWVTGGRISSVGNMGTPHFKKRSPVQSTYRSSRIKWLFAHEITLFVKSALRYRCQDDDIMHPINGLRSPSTTITMTLSSSRTIKLAAILTVLSSSDAFAPSQLGRVSRSDTVAVSAKIDENEGWKTMTGGAASFLTGLGFMAQVAFADSASIASLDRGENFWNSYWSRN